MKTKSTINKLLSTMLVLCMVFSLFAAMPITASAANYDVANATQLTSAFS